MKRVKIVSLLVLSLLVETGMEETLDICISFIFTKLVKKLNQYSTFSCSGTWSEIQFDQKFFK